MNNKIENSFFNDLREIFTKKIIALLNEILSDCRRVKGYGLKR